MFRFLWAFAIATVASPSTADSLIYVTDGHVRFRRGDEVAEVRAGDFIREEAGMTHVWDQLEDSGFITTTGFAPSAKATP